MTVADPVIHQISQRVYRTIAAAAAHHPAWLADKYQSVQWADPRPANLFIEQFTDRLKQSPDEAVLLARLERYLEALFSSSFFSSAAYATLRQEIEQVLQDRPWPVQSASGLPVAALAIAVLLLDAENMHLTPLAEQSLQSVCQYPMRIKVAFGNWRSQALHKRDVDLHQRGYQMIHVPAGKNNADMKMTAIGASMFTHHPTVREVLVCSSDSDLTHLCHSLQFHGLMVYSVHRKENRLVVVNPVTRREKVLSATKLNIQSPIELEQELAEVLRDLIGQSTDSSDGYLPIGKLGSQFQQMYGCSVSEYLGELGINHRYLTFLQSCSTFKLKQTDKHWQITLA